MKVLVVWALGAAAIVSLAVFVAVWLRPRPFNWRVDSTDNLVSCRNHATFFNLALADFVNAHGFLPEDPGMTSEQVALESEEAREACTACNLGPRKDYCRGGWQLVTLHRAVWSQVLAAWRGTEIPLGWCGRVHKGLGEAPPGRIVFLITTPGLSRLLRPGRAPRWSSFPDEIQISYGLDERDLTAQVADLNRILRSLGEPEVPVDLPRP